MKTLKYLLSAAMVAAIATSCNDDDYIDETSSSVSPESIYEFSAAELEKMAYGCEYYLDENNAEKIETRATDEYLSYIKCQMDSFEQASVKTSHLKSTGIGLVGVLKESTCGNYPQFSILYDCENKNSCTALSGYANQTESKTISFSGDLLLTFCVVPASLFGSIGEHYAVLRLSTDLINQNNHNIYHINIQMDAEDKSDGIYTAIVNTQNTINEDYDTFFTPNRISKQGNLYLSFQHYTAEYNDGTLPNIGFNYGVFGTLRNRMHGTILSDDEDKNNDNHIREWCYYPTKANDNEKEINFYDKNCYNIFHVGKNTNMFISQVLNK